MSPSDSRHVVIPARLLEGNLLPLRCLVTGATKGVELHTFELSSTPWWSIAAILSGVGIVALLAFTPVTLRLALPFTQPAARHQRASGSFGLLDMAFTAGLSLLHEWLFISAFQSYDMRDQQFSFLLYLPLHICTVLCVSFMFFGPWQVRHVSLVGGDLQQGVVLRLPDKSVAAALRAEVAAMSTDAERETILANVLQARWARWRRWTRWARAPSTV